MIFRILQIAIPFVWFGLILGISFLEAPLKFQAPDITLALGLGIGRLVFFALNKIEIVLALALMISFFRSKPDSKTPFYLFTVIGLLLFLETIWLLPVLDERAVSVIKGTAAPYSNTHVIYIVFDAIKLILLAVLGVISSKNYMSREH